MLRKSLQLLINAQYLYHVTEQDNVLDIAEHGLQVGEGGKLSRGLHEEYSKDRVFLTDEGTLPNWEYYVDQMAYDSENDKKPLVLRVNVSSLDNILVDERGTRDAPRLAPYDYYDTAIPPPPDPTTFSYYVEDTIPPEVIEVELGNYGWTPITELVDPDREYKRYQLDDRAPQRAANGAYGPLTQALKMIAFPFLADPPTSEDQKYMGIRKFPGFHTTTTFTTAAMYALGHIDQNFTEYPDSDDESPAYVTDYPVVVELDMAGYEKQTDYDAEEIVKDTLQIQLDSFLSEEQIDEATTDEEIESKLQNFVDGYDADYSEYNTDPLDFLSENTFMHFNTPLYTILNSLDPAAIIREYIRTGVIPSDVLMEAADQYRYTEDINEDQIVRVSYIQPIANEMVDDYEDTDVETRWPGFDIIGPDETYEGYFEPTSQVVWERPHEGETEYHGTTYNRLLSAAPFLAAVLPSPPKPPYGGV